MPVVPRLQPCAVSRAQLGQPEAQPLLLPGAQDRHEAADTDNLKDPDENHYGDQEDDYYCSPCAYSSLLLILLC